MSGLKLFNFCSNCFVLFKFLFIRKKKNCFKGLSIKLSKKSVSISNLCFNKFISFWTAISSPPST